MPNPMPLRPLAMLVGVIFAMATGGASAQQREVDRAADRGDQAKERAAPRVPRHAHSRSAEQRALSAAVRRVEGRTGGQVLSAERIPFDGRDVSRIKVVDASGRVRIYMDDPKASSPRSERPARPARTRDDDN